MPNTPKNENGFIQLIMMGEFIRQIWVKLLISSEIWFTIELNKDIMLVLTTAKNEEDPIENEVDNTKYQYFKHSRAANAAFSGWIWPKF